MRRWRGVAPVHRVWLEALVTVNAPLFLTASLPHLGVADIPGGRSGRAPSQYPSQYPGQEETRGSSCLPWPGSTLGPYHDLARLDPRQFTAWWASEHVLARAPRPRLCAPRWFDCYGAAPAGS